MSQSKRSLGRIARAVAARVPEPRTAHRLLRQLTHPLHPDDYSSLIYPLWSSRELRGEVISVRREADDAVTLAMRELEGDLEPGEGDSDARQNPVAEGEESGTVVEGVRADEGDGATGPGERLAS